MARNYHSGHVTFYYRLGSSRELLGRVPAGQTANFHIRVPASAVMRFEIDVFDGKRCTTSSNTVAPGEHLFVWMRPARLPDGRQCDFRAEAPGR